MKRYLLFILIALDQLGTALLGGYPDETLSSYAWRLEQKGRLAGRISRPVIDWLFSPFGPSHCYEAFLSEQHRRQLPREFTP